MPGALGIGARLEPRFGGGASKGVLWRLTHVRRGSGWPWAVLAGTNDISGVGADCPCSAGATQTSRTANCTNVSERRLVISHPGILCIDSRPGSVINYAAVHRLRTSLRAGIPLHRGQRDHGPTGL